VLALKNRVCSENFHCIEYIFFYLSGFLSNLRLPRKQSLTRNFSSRPAPSPRTPMLVPHLINKSTVANKTQLSTLKISSGDHIASDFLN